jgi:hypothetical protein
MTNIVKLIHLKVPTYTKARRTADPGITEKPLKIPLLQKQNT